MSKKVVTVPLKTLPGLPQKYARMLVDPDGQAVLGVNLFYQTASGQLLLLSAADILNNGSVAASNVVNFRGDIPGSGNQNAGSQSNLQLTSDVTGSGTGSIATQVAQGAVTDTKAAVSWKPPVRLVATSNQTLSGLPTIDGVATAAADVVLLTAQTTASQNGPWIVAAGAWARPTWFPAGGKTQAFKGGTFIVQAGSAANAGTVWSIPTTGAITIGTTALAVSNIPITSTPSGAVAGDLSGTLPNPTVDAILGVSIISSTLTSGNLLIANGGAGGWVSTPITGDVSITSGGLVTVTGIAGFPLGTVTAASGQILIGLGGTAFAGRAVAGDATLSSLGILRVTQINGGPIWNLLSAAADQVVTNNAALQSDAVLTFPMAASTNYRIRGHIFLDGSSLTAAMKYAFSGPAAPTLVRFERWDNANGGAPTGRAIDVAIPGSTTLVTATADAGEMVRFEGIVQNGVNAGTFVFQFAQSVATVAQTVTRRAGSYMEWAVA